ncbi:MAG: hypothetical protein ABEJ86_06870 [Halococcoides sp.]
MGDLGAVEYLGHQLLMGHQEQRGLVPKTVFHKLWCISARHLEDNHETEIGLPRYWNKYGEMVDEQSVNDEFYSAPSAPWGGQAYKPDWQLDSDDFDISTEERKLVDRTVKWTLNRFKRRKSRYLEAYQYQTYSPNDFIRAYSELREHLQYMDLDSQQVLTQLTFRPEFEAESNDELLTSYLDELVITYPENDEAFSAFQPLFLRWDDTARLLLERDRPYDELETILDEFVDALSKAVLQVKYNDSVPDERLSRWRENAEDARASFERYLDEFRTDLLVSREQSGVLDSVSETYDDTVRSDFESDR